MISKAFIGVDPDLHNTSIAIIDECGQVADLRIASIAPSLKGREAIVAMSEKILAPLLLDPSVNLKAFAVEGQELYQFGPSKTVNPKSIVYLATVAGMALTLLKRYVGAACYFPTPQAWKGSVPKQIHQARILGRLGWTYEKSGTQESGYCYPSPQPSGPGFFAKKSEWKHLADAIGLAQYAREQWLDEQGRLARRAAIEAQP